MYHNTYRIDRFLLIHIPSVCKILLSAECVVLKKIISLNFITEENFKLKRTDLNTAVAATDD